MTLDGIPLTEGTDYLITAGYETLEHKQFYPLRELTGTITIIYWYPDISASGFYLASLPWQQITYSLGTHYPISMTHDPPSIGDRIFLNRTKVFFLDTPLLGEIDWSWYWLGSSKPRRGYFKIDILDVVKCTSAYCSRGDGAYDPIYVPSADIDANDLCHIGILDLVTISGKYAQTFGLPP